MSKTVAHPCFGAALSCYVLHCVTTLLLETEPVSILNFFIPVDRRRSALLDYLCHSTPLWFQKVICHNYSIEVTDLVRPPAITDHIHINPRIRHFLRIQVPTVNISVRFTPTCPDYAPAHVEHAPRHVPRLVNTKSLLWSIRIVTCHRWRAGDEIPALEWNVSYVLMRVRVSLARLAGLKCKLRCPRFSTDPFQIAIEEPWSMISNGQPMVM